MKYRVEGVGPAVVLLHGHMFNSLMWEPFVDKLKGKYTCVLIDLYGHGKSSTPLDNISMEYQAKGIKEVLNKLSISKATIIGHSMGGYIALSFAKLYPKVLDGLCLFHSKPQADSEEKKSNREEAIQKLKENREDFIRHAIRGLFNPNELKENSDKIEIARSWALSNSNEGIIAGLRGMRDREDTTTTLQQLDIPVEIILGEFDSAINKDEVLSIIPNKNNFHSTVLKTGHMSHLEAEEESYNAINQFLKKVHY